MRPVTITITNLIVGTAHITSYPYRPKPRILYKVPLYRVTVEGKDERNNSVTEDFKAIRFGVHRTPEKQARVVGLADAQTHTLSWSYIRTMQGEAWRVYDGFFIHKGPANPTSEAYGSIGCVEICGANEWDRFNDTIKKLAGLDDLARIGNNHLLTAEYQRANRPPLIKVNR